MDFNHFLDSGSQSKLRFPVSKNDFYPCLDDKTTYTGFDRHYVYHPAWAARVIKEINPELHIDISSTLHFCSILSAFVPVKFFDYRPAKLMMDNLTSEFADLLNLHFPSSSVHSISCMHTIEHIGLGRYGDPIDYDGDIKAIHELKRVVSENGHFLLVVPVGRPRIAYNAHRIYSYDQIISYMDGFQLKQFALIPDSEELGLIFNAEKELVEAQEYGCGCFWFQKM